MKTLKALDKMIQSSMAKPDKELQPTLDKIDNIFKCCRKSYPYLEYCIKENIMRNYVNARKGESIRPYLTAEQIAEMDELQNIDTGLLVAVNEFEARKQLLAAQLERIRTERK